VLFLELHSGNKHSLPGADLTEQPKAFLRFKLATLSCSLSRTTTDSLSSKKLLAPGLAASS
jgi:hypothetical protein